MSAAKLSLGTSNYMKASQDAGTKGKSRCKQLQAAFFISFRVSLSDFRIFVSAPAASRRDKMSAAKLSLGHLPDHSCFSFGRHKKMW